MRNDILEQAQEIRTSIDSMTGTMADADAAKNPMLFLPWETDTKYAVGDRRRHDGKVYKCIGCFLLFFGLYAKGLQSCFQLFQLCFLLCFYFFGFFFYPC